MISTQLFSTLTVTKLQSFKVGANEKIWCICAVRVHRT